MAKHVKARSKGGRQVQNPWAMRDRKKKQYVQAFSVWERG